jgi:hypothetical protein
MPEAKPPNCECDYDYQGEETGYVKTSHYCPLHDQCDACMDKLGTHRDPTWKINGRDAWICDDPDCGAKRKAQEDIRWFLGRLPSWMRNRRR